MFLRFLKTHWPGIVISIIVGLFVVGPNLILMTSPEYRGYPFMGTDGEPVYLARLNAAYIGCIYACNPYIKEYGSTFPFFDPSIAEFIEAIPGIIFHIPAVTLNIIYEFLLPTLLTFLIYLFIFRLTKKRSWSVVGALTIMLGYNIINSSQILNLDNIVSAILLTPDFLTHHLTGLIGHSVDSSFISTDYAQFLRYQRPINPQFSSIIFLIYLHILLSYLKTQKRKWLIVLTFVYGLSFYIYFYLYTFLTVIQGVIIITNFIQRKYKQSFLFLSSTIVGVGSGWYTLFEVYSYLKNPYHIDFSANSNSGVVFTHLPNISYIGVILFIASILILYIYHRQFRVISPESLIFFILALSSFIILNQQIISGVSVQNFHYLVYYIDPIFIITLCYVGTIFISSRYKKMIISLSIIISVAVLLNAYLIQRTSFSVNYSYTIYYSNHNDMKAINWLNNNTPQGSVVDGPKYITEAIPIFTHNYVLSAPNAEVTYLFKPDRTISPLSLFSSSKRSFVQNIIQEYSINYIVEDKTDKHTKYSPDQQFGTVVYEDDIYIIFKTSVPS